MNFLALVQKTGRDSGTVTGSNPASVASQTGWNLQIVNAVLDAWNNIQNEQAAWRWLEGEFEEVTIANTKRYTATGWDITRFSEWIIRPRAVTMYLTATGVSDEGELGYISWDRWKQLYDRGTQTADRPIHYSISPANEFCLGPVPSAVYTVRGPYRKGNQTLSVNADTPEMPERFHELIVCDALELLAGHDEAPTAVAVAAHKQGPLRSALMRDQLPRIEVGAAPIA